MALHWGLGTAASPQPLSISTSCCCLLFWNKALTLRIAATLGLCLISGEGDTQVILPHAHPTGFPAFRRQNFCPAVLSKQRVTSWMFHGVF